MILPTQVVNKIIGKIKLVAEVHVHHNTCVNLLSLANVFLRCYKIRKLLSAIRLIWQIIARFDSDLNHFYCAILEIFVHAKRTANMIPTSSLFSSTCTSCAADCIRTIQYTVVKFCGRKIGISRNRRELSWNREMIEKREMNWKLASPQFIISDNFSYYQQKFKGHYSWNQTFFARSARILTSLL